MNTIHSGQLKSGPWLLEASGPDDAWQGADWRHAKDGGAVVSGVRPPLSSDVPHPTKLQLSTPMRRRVEAASDPEHDPYGVLDGTGQTFENLVQNKLSHHAHMTPEQSFNGRVWYRSGHDMAKDVAHKTVGENGLTNTPEKVVGAMAAFSPVKPWDENVEHTTHFLTHYNGDDRHPYQQKTPGDYPSFGMPTMDFQVNNAKRIWHGENPQDVLGGPKTRTFSNNLLDPSPLREARAGVDDDHGYYQLPTNPHTGEPDWRLHPDQDTTVDTQEVRGANTPHGSDLRGLEYKTPPYFGRTFKARDADGNVQEYDPSYDLHARANWEMTRRINAARDDPMQHLIPKQGQAGPWLKFRQDVDDVSGKYKAESGAAPKWVSQGDDPAKHPLDPKAIPRYQQDYGDWEDPRRPSVDLRSTPNWRPRHSSWYITAEDKDDDSTTSAPAGNEDPQQPTSAPPINIPGVHPQTMTMQLPAVTPMTMNPNLPHGMTNMGELGPSNFGGGGSAPSAPPRVPHTEAVPSYGGGTPPPDAPHVPPAPAGAGGVAAATALAQGANGNPYDYGGAGNGHYDCSGYQSDIYNALTGKPLGQRSFSTTSDFGALGFQPGFDPKSKYNIGVIPQAGMNGHMVGELNGVPLESGGAANKTQYGGSAAGPLNPEFPVHYHLPDSMIVAPAPVAAPAAASHVGPAGKTGRNWYLTATDWGAMPDAQVMGPSAPPGYHPGPTPTSPWSNSAPALAGTSGSTSAKPASNPGGSGENITTPSGTAAPTSNVTPGPGDVPIVQDRPGHWTSPNPAWQHLINRESGGNPGITNTSPSDPNAGPNASQGLFQFTPQTWHGLGHPGMPGQASPQEQAQAAGQLIRQNPSGGDWGAGLSGRENAQALGAGLSPETTSTTSGPPGSHSSSIHSGRPKSGPWLLEASRHQADLSGYIVSSRWYITADDDYGDTESGEQDSDTGGEGYGGKPPDA